MHVDVHVRHGRIESRADLDELIRVHPVHEVRRRIGRMRQALELLGKAAANGEAKSLERRRVLLGVFKDGETLPAQGANVLDAAITLRLGDRGTTANARDRDGGQRAVSASSHF